MNKLSDDLMEGATRDRVLALEAQVKASNFEDVQAFQRKFSTDPDSLGYDNSHRLPLDVALFKANFLLEELGEYLNAIGLKFELYGPGFRIADAGLPFNAEKAFDSLIDLVYVALGAADTHRFPWQAGWDRVQAVNMQKVRATHAEDPLSVRKHSVDVVKPEGWKPPVLSDLL